MSLQPQETGRRAASSVLCAIMAEAAAALQGDAAFAAPGVGILTEDKGDIDTEIEQAIAALGLCVVVMFADASDCKPTLPGPVFGRVQLVVEVSENATTNRAAGGRSALEVAEHAARILHQFRMASGRVLLVESVRPFANPPQPATVCYHVSLRTSEVSINRRTTP